MKEMVYQEKRTMEILFSGEYKGRKFAILNLGLHPTAYVSLTKAEADKSQNYDDYDLTVHGGFTYMGASYWDKSDTETVYIGWDYAHCDDYSGYDIFFKGINYGKKWTTDEIYEEVKSVIEQFDKGKWIVDERQKNKFICE